LQHTYFLVALCYTLGTAAVWAARRSKPRTVGV